MQRSAVRSSPPVIIGNRPSVASQKSVHYNDTKLSNYAKLSCITTIVGNRPLRRDPPSPRVSVVTAVRMQASSHRTTNAPPQQAISATPTLCVLNAAALSKPGAVDHLATDLKSTGASIAVITETHFKQKHADSVIGIVGYTLYRRDRTGRRGGGVAMYVQSNIIQATIWSPTSSVDSRAFELLWLRVGVLICLWPCCTTRRALCTLFLTYSAMLRTVSLKLAMTTRLQKSYWLATSTSCKTITLSSARDLPRLFISLPVEPTCLTECSFSIHRYIVQSVSSHPWSKVTTEQSWRRRAEQPRLSVKRVGNTHSGRERRRRMRIYCST